MVGVARTAFARMHSRDHVPTPQASTVSQLLNPSPTSKQSQSLHKSLRWRELNAQRHSTRNAVYQTLAPAAKFTGTSGDVISVAWADNGRAFAAGSAAWSDENNLQYNRPNNLLIGDSIDRTLRELPQHATKRVRTQSGINASHAMHASQDPLVFQTVSSVAFVQGQLVTTGYDGYVHIFHCGGTTECSWELACEESRSKEAVSFQSIEHSSPIDVLATNTGGWFATGSQAVTNHVRVFARESDDGPAACFKEQARFSSRRSKVLKAMQGGTLTASSLRFGHPIYAQLRYLLAGFSSEEEFGKGETCIWDLEHGKKLIHVSGETAVFDQAWCPTWYGRFARASPSLECKGKSVVDIFDSSCIDSRMSVKQAPSITLRCPALDINDVVFNQTDFHLLSVGATNGSVYVWDLRRPGEIMHTFSHGNPSAELDNTAARETVDTGVRFLTWDVSSRGLISGSSDGVVAHWDPYRASEDSHVRDLVQLDSGIMSGAFSPDHSSLLLGEVSGSLNLLAIDDTAPEPSFRLQRASVDELAALHKTLNVVSGRRR